MSIAKSFNPIFIERTKDGTETIYDVPSRLIKERRIFLDDEITQSTASMIASLIFLLDKKSTDEPIDLWINSPGGSVQGFFAIYDMMHRVEAPIRTVCIGEAASAAALLLAAGSPGQRYAMPHSRIMIHQVQIEGLGGSGTEVEIESKELKKIKQELTEVLARHTGNTVAKIKRDTDHDKYMGAQEAISYGIVDHVMTYHKPIPELKKKVVKESNG